MKAQLIKTSKTASSVNIDMIIALLPVIIFASATFGARVLAIVAVSVVSAIITEALLSFLLKRNTVSTATSGAVTGLLISIMLPPSAPIWMGCVASVFAVAVIKISLKAVGSKIIPNPSATAILLLCSIFGNKAYLSPLPNSEGSALELSPSSLFFSDAAQDISVFDLLTGNRAGLICEISILLCIAGGIYLICRRAVDRHIPISFIATYTVALYLLSSFDIQRALLGLICSSVIPIAVFIAPDGISTPMNKSARLVFGALAGALSATLSVLFGRDASLFALIIANLLAYPLDMLLRPAVFGVGKGKKA